MRDALVVPVELVVTERDIVAVPHMVGLTVDVGEADVVRLIFAESVRAGVAELHAEVDAEAVLEGEAVDTADLDAEQV